MTRTLYPGDTKERAVHPMVSRDRMLERQHLEQMAESDEMADGLRELRRQELERAAYWPELVIAVLLVGCCVAWVLL